MWMVFIDGSNTYFQISTNACVTALNGKIISGGNASNDRLRVIDFLLDNEVEFSHTAGRRTTLNPISDRNGSTAFGPYDSSLQGVINRYINDVAMTVLPNAPIDDATGLPVPTIAVATNGGFSVIKDDGTEIDKGVTSTVTNEVAWYKGQYLLGSGPEYWALYKDLSEETSGYISGTADLYSAGNQTSWDKPQPTGQESQVIAAGDLIVGGSTAAYTGQQPGLSLKHPTSNLSNGSSNLLCEIRKDYNTGWMHGDIKGAFLSSIDDTNITGEKIDLTNGEAVTGQAGNFSSVSANSLVAGTTSDVLGRYNTGTHGGHLVNGRQYLATLTISNYSGSGNLGVASGAGFDGTFRYSANGTYRTYITYTSGEVQIFYRNTNTATIGLTLKEVDVDRSVNKKGLAIHGTITKTPVATGAELVSYDSLTSSNYLEQPYNSDLNFATRDFCMMGWVYNVGTSASILYRLHNSTSAGIGYIVATSSGGEIGYSSYTQGFSSSGRITHYTSDTWNGRPNWNMFVCGKKGGIGYMYVNGVLKQSGVNNQSHTDTTYNPPLRIGNNHAGNGGIGGGKLALIRISGSFPSDEQIKKMYNDEKCLFHENAKCTLYGTAANAVTALAYDDTTNILHVGTSSGRSEFQGLNRINNTTTAVTTVISASNGFVAEQ